MKAGLFMGRIRNKGSLYFQRIENSTKVKLPDCKAWVVRMDAINTKDNIEDPFSEEVGKFAYSIKKTAEEFSRIFEGAIVYAESDEISIVFLDKIRIESLVGSAEAGKVNSLMSQYVYKIFNSFSNTEMMFDTKVFSIHSDKVVSYLKYRMIYAEVYTINYYSKDMKYSERIGKSNSYMKNKLADIGIKWAQLNPHSREGSLYINGEVFYGGPGMIEETLKSRFVMENNFVYDTIDEF